MSILTSEKNGNPTKIGIIEDSDKLLQNYITFFDAQENYEVCWAFSSIDEFILGSKKKLTKPKIILLDLNLPGISGIEGIKILKKYFPKANIVILSAFSNSNQIIQAFGKGAEGYLVKGAPMTEIKRLLDNYHQGDGYAISPIVAKKIIDSSFKNIKDKEAMLSFLTRREKEITRLIVNGLTYKEVGEILFIQPTTVNHHLKKIYAKMGVSRKADLVNKIFRNDFIQFI
jgi:DNA-binding NarL/FixJ family response regulator